MEAGGLGFSALAEVADAALPSSTVAVTSVVALADD